MAQDKLKHKTIRLFGSQLEYLDKTHGKNTDQFIRVALDKAIDKDKKEKGIN